MIRLNHIDNIHYFFFEWTQKVKDDLVLIEQMKNGGDPLSKEKFFSEYPNIKDKSLSEISDMTKRDFFIR